ncbi:hypothetical protein PAUR_a2836 [Pseudoalteromonas aurantia 208]|uniref:HNH endonuclease n=1 Tax=Pseudoalteromonas aurantia 208 TaxID=1314867 RepID=A0ABR9EF85_9GAMM|nr:hypothetical protein [Pseudoalteromonas aurantia 208]
MGICQLTGKEGKYVKSHIIPKSLTRPKKSGNKFLQPDVKAPQKRFIKRADSWYDKSIVIREGEDFLSDIDSHAIDELRAQGLLWSSDKVRMQATHSKNELTVVSFSEPRKIRKYFLSLLWRAAVSTLPELEDIILNRNQKEQLRQIIIGESEDDLSLFPTTLIQLTTEGPAHNFAPIKLKVHDREVYRFYMNGLIAHIYLHNTNMPVLMNPVPYDHPIFVGSERTLVSQVKTEHSFQLNNLKRGISELRGANCEGSVQALVNKVI